MKRYAVCITDDDGGTGEKGGRQNGTMYERAG